LDPTLPRIREGSYLISIHSEKSNSIVDFVVEVSKGLRNKIAVMVYILLYDLACKSNNIDNTIVASHEQIADRLDISVRSSARAIQFLRLNGYIEAYRLQNTGKKYQPNTIKVKFPGNLMCKMLDHSDPQRIPFVHLNAGEHDDC
jgi:hypothetical protein